MNGKMLGRRMAWVEKRQRSRKKMRAVEKREWRRELREQRS